MESDDTREKLVKALKSLTKDKPVSKITVGEISKEAGVSRQTFYYHFGSIFEIYQWAVISKLTHKRRVPGASPSILVNILDWCHALEKNKSLTLAFYNSEYIPQFFMWLRDENMPVARAFITHYVDTELSPAHLESAANFLTGACLGIISEWIRDSMDKDIDDVYNSIAVLLNTALKPDIAEIIEKNWNSAEGVKGS